jgi:hypothetical protein
MIVQHYYVFSQKRHPPIQIQSSSNNNNCITPFTLSTYTLVTIAMSSTNKDPYQVFINMTKHTYAYYKSGSGDAGSLLYLKTCI